MIGGGIVVCGTPFFYFLFCLLLLGSVVPHAAHSIMETVNPLLASALELLREGNIEAAETGFGEAAAACCEAYGEARYFRCTILDP